MSYIEQTHKQAASIRRLIEVYGTPHLEVTLADGTRRFTFGIGTRRFAKTIHPSGKIT